MVDSALKFQSYCWSLGTTSFRTKNFNLTIEVQLFLLNEFWKQPKYKGQRWSSNSPLQEAYYDFLKENEFLTGSAARKDKDAREKTSGLVDLGLVDDERRLTDVGKALLEISQNNDFDPNNSLQLPADSFIYFKQLLKTTSDINGNPVRPYIILVYVLNKVGYLTNDEYTYLLPLCTSPESTEIILSAIPRIRSGETTIDSTIIDVFLRMDNYRVAHRYFMEHKVTESLICEIGLNRKSRSYDKEYYPFYSHLSALSKQKSNENILKVLSCIQKGKSKAWDFWKSYLFTTSNAISIEHNPVKYLRNVSILADDDSEYNFKQAFFLLLHLFKIKATLSDYHDLNRRYFKITDTVRFADGVVELDIIPKQYFNNAVVTNLYKDAFQDTHKLQINCSLEEINPLLKINEDAIIEGIEDDLGVTVNSMDDVRKEVDRKRHERFINIINEKYSDEQLISLLSLFENRDDDKIKKYIECEATAPTIFEYVIGIIWYKISELKGNILDYFNLSLDADLLPVTHAGGGIADIVYEYPHTTNHPEHSLLIEVTLEVTAGQRKMEAEPVSRHLGNHILETGNRESYCIFSTTHLDPNLQVEFRTRKDMPYYYSKDYSKSLQGLKIIPLESKELKTILKKGIKYDSLYRLFELAHDSKLRNPREWYQSQIVEAIENF